MEKEALVETLLDAGVATTTSKREALLDAGAATTASKREALLDAGVVTTASKRETLLDAGIATTEEKAYWCPSEHVGALFGYPGCVCNLPVVERLSNAEIEALYASLDLEYGERFEAVAIETKEAA